MPTLSLCADYSNRFFFGGPYLQTGAGRYSGEAAVSQLATLVNGQNVLFLIPGFNNSADNAQASFNTISQNLVLRKMLGAGCAYDVAIGVLWPGRSAPGYCLAETSAKRSADKLREIVLKLHPRSLSIEAHSLGNLLTLHANRDGGLNLESFISCSAAVDDEAIEKGSQYFQAVSSIKGKALIVYSRRDEVLGKDYRWLGSVPRDVWSWIKTKTQDGGFGDIALGFNGPEHGTELIPSNVKLCDATSWCFSHGGARESGIFYDNWSAILP